ncbi:MAG: nitrogen fixation protein NifQ [Novosphingobium sp.]|nr:nitrogen fixation protein NifQ [Novosphingobium sp.]
MARAEHLYRELFDRGTAKGADLFDLHVAASIVALAAGETERDGVSLAERIGLRPSEIDELSALFFPGAVLNCSASPSVDQQEQALRDILWMNSAHASVFELLLSRMIARRSLRPNHLWQDLGLANRGELSMLMERHFPRLARRNSADMKWKKFFYRMMCSSEGFRLCAAPVCTECDDFEDCFGSEDGEALLARIANGRNGSMEAQI